MISRPELAAILLSGYLLDLLLGDPRWIYHPVRLMGLMIEGTERLVRRFCERSEKALLAGGVFLVVLVLFETAFFFGGILFAAFTLNRMAGLFVSVFFCWQALAVRSLKTESMNVYRELKTGTLADARKAVSRIVGRDTKALTFEGVTKAAVETVEENTSDGVVAPLFYLALGGPLLGLLYKAVNTMDSMVGYKNDKYLFFGRAAAKLDDAANFLPSRLSALLMIAAAFLSGLDWRGAWRIFKRDRFCHASPNSAQTEAACAGALGIRLAGDAWYFGTLYKKPFIGDDRRPPVPEDIRLACRLLYWTAFLSAALFCGIQLLF